jgi:hypothetical protein
MARQQAGLIAGKKLFFKITKDNPSGKNIFLFLPASAWQNILYGTRSSDPAGGFGRY